MVRPRIVVLGASYGGFAFLKAWHYHPDPPPAIVTLVDRRPYHTLKTLLHRVAVGKLSENLVRLPLSRPLGNELIVDEVMAIDRYKRQVRLGSGDTLDWDYLIIALGSRANFFNIPGAADHGLPLWDLDSALRVRDRLFRLEREEQEHGGTTSVAVAGAGFTGIEISSELTRPGYPVTLIEAMPRLVPQFGERTASWLTSHLNQQGVNLLLNSPIAEVTPTELILKNGQRIPYRMLIWTTGIAGHPLYRELDFTLDPSGRIIVQPDLRPDGEERIFVIGDAARSELPPTAQTAELQGERAAANLVQLLKGKEPSTSPISTRGVLVTVGKRKGFGQLGRTEFHGVVPFVLKKAVDAVYAREVRSLNRRWQALKATQSGR